MTWRNKVAVLCIAAASAAQADPKHCRQLADASPSTVLGVPMAPVRDLESVQPGAGYSVGFRTQEDDIFTVYFFDAGAPVLTGEHELGYFVGSIGDMRTIAERGGYSFGPFEANDVSGVGSFLKYMAEATDSQGRFHVAAMGRSGACLVKLRLTTSRPPNEGRNLFWASTQAFQIDR